MERTRLSGTHQTPLEGKVVVLGVTGSIAAFKAASISTGLRQLGADVHVAMTRSAKGFITPQTFRGLTGREPYSDVTASYAQYGGEPHIWLGRNFDVYLIAPLSGNSLAQLALGFDGDSPVALTYRARCKDRPVLVAPAMDSNMWGDEGVRANAALLASRGVVFLGPEAGRLASGEQGCGRMTDPSVIIDHVRYQIGQIDGPLKGQTVVITAGPTREWLDAVRHITNSSTGQMAYALARAVRDLGGTVKLVSSVSGNLSTPAGVTLIKVEDARSMLDATVEAAKDALALIGAAAVGDYGIVTKLDGKTDRRKTPTMSLDLRANPDIIATVECPHKFGFAAELPQDLLVKARKKIVEKGLRGIFGNSTAAFGSENNSGILISPDKSEQRIPEMSKESLARLLATNWLIPLTRSGGGEGEERWSLR